MTGDTADHLAIRDLIARYSDCLNRGDGAGMAQLFTPDAIWRVDAPFDLEFAGADIAAAIGGMIASYGFLIQMVQGSVVEIAADGLSATARTTIREMGQARDGSAGLDNLGIYHDRLVRLTDGWRFAARRFQPVYLDTAPLRGTVVAG